MSADKCLGDARAADQVQFAAIFGGQPACTFFRVSIRE